MIGQDGIVVYYKSEISDVLNHCFVSIAEKTGKFIITIVRLRFPPKYLLPPLDKSMFLSPVTKSEVMNIVTLMKRGNSEAIDGSFSNLMKVVMPDITTVFTHIINLMFQTGGFPSSFKVSKVLLFIKGITVIFHLITAQF